jgi:outer membrane protein OmpA-like peptidoglycan-associated protein
MRIAVNQWVALGALAPALACVHPKQYQKDLADTRAEIAQEKTDRVAGDSANKADIASVRADVAALRASMDSMKTDFNAKISQVAAGMQYNLPVTFAYNDAAVQDADHAVLDRFASVYKKYYAGARLTVEGFADPAGGKQFNVKLSQKRADAVRDYLAQQGIDVATINTVGYGKTRLVNPKAKKDDPGAQDNRRAVFVIETRPEGQQGPGTPAA